MRINNIVNLSLKNFIILLIILISLVSLYNRLFIHFFYYPLIKHKNIIKKYKSILEKCHDKLTNYEQIIDTQNQIINQITQSEQVPQIGSHSSSHDEALTPSKFNPNPQNMGSLPVAMQQPSNNPNSIQQSTNQLQFQSNNNNNLNQLDDQLMSSIDSMLQQNMTNHKQSISPLDEFWSMTNISPYSNNNNNNF